MTTNNHVSDIIITDMNARIDTLSAFFDLVVDRKRSHDQHGPANKAFEKMPDGWALIEAAADMAEAVSGAVAQYLYELRPHYSIGERRCPCGVCDPEVVVDDDVAEAIAAWNDAFQSEDWDELVYGDEPLQQRFDRVISKMIQARNKLADAFASYDAQRT